MKKVNIILPAYQGEKYIGEQIESLLAQTWGNIDIYIRDDHSGDQTLNIIQSYVGREPEGKRIIVIDNEGTNWGYVRNVFDTWKLTAPADYYCFCDQDDVWHADKVEKSVALLEKNGEHQPGLCFTAFNYCHSDLQFMRKSEPAPDQLNLCCVCYDYPVLNFNITVNHAFRELVFSRLPEDGRYPCHPDSWMAKAAAALGRLFSLDEIMVEYRRNEQAVTYSNRSWLNQFIWRFKHFIMSNDVDRIQRDLVSFYSAYKDILNEEDRQMMEIFTQKSATHYFQKLFYPAKLRRKTGDEIGLRMMFLFGRL